MIQILPAIDIIGGKCVRLSQGDYNQCTTYTPTPADMARMYADAGVERIHVVDLDGAKSSCPANLRTLEEITALGLVKVEWGGGIKSRQSLCDVLSAGADYAIVGSIAAQKPHLFEEWLGEFGGDKLILGADLKGGKVSVNGWKEEVAMGIGDIVERFLPFGLKEVICTDISKDGMLAGPAFSLYIGLQKQFPGVGFTVSGGISSMSDIVQLNDLGLEKVIVGKAIYENKITLEEIRQWLQRG